MKLEKYLNEEKLIKSMDIDVIFKKPFNTNDFKKIKIYFEKLIKKEPNISEINIDYRYE